MILIEINHIHLNLSYLPTHNRILTIQGMHYMVSSECKPNCPLFELLSKDEAPRDGTLLSVVAQLKNMIDKREDAEVVEEWLEAVDTATIIGDLAGYSREVRLYEPLFLTVNPSV